MAPFVMGLLIILVVACAGFMKLWADTMQLRNDVARLRETQDTLIDMVSSKLLEDDALSREFLKLKTGRRIED